MKMQESILNRVYKMEEKYNIHYAKKDGKAYSYSRVLYFLFGAWAVFFALLVAVGFLMNRTFLQPGDVAYGQYTKWIVACFCISALLIAGIVFNALKMQVFTFVPTVFSGVYGIVFFAKVINPDPDGILGLPFKYYWAHFVPFLALVICSLVMFVIGVRQWAILRKEYKSVSARLYEEFTVNAEDISDEQWQEFLNNYNPTGYKKQFKKQEE